MDEQNLFSLKDKLIVITGASSGIGKATALLCSRLGARLVLIARNEERLKQSIDQLYGVGHCSYSFDVTAYTEITDLIEKITSTSGKIDGFMHSAGVVKTLPLKVSKPEYLLDTLSVNLVSGFEFVRLFSRLKTSNESASFVLISSVMGLVGSIGLSSYCASKGALISGVKALALELSLRRQRINCISPAMVRTEMTNKEFSLLSDAAVKEIEAKHPLGFGSPEDVACSAAFLLSDASRWITGSNLVIDGGYTAR